MNRFLISLISASLLSTAAMAGDNTASLKAALAAQPEEVQARYGARHPLKTLGFFGIEPGMTVVEGLPGSGWYSKVLLPYLGSDGVLIGADYAADMYPLFGFFPQETLDAKHTWVTDWPVEANEWRGDDSASIKAFQFGSMPDDMKGSADAVFLVRALHNLARFESQGEYLSRAISDAFNVLKPGGVLGIVQHQAREDMPDDWASGARGYLKESFITARMEAAGFVLEATSGINNNPADQPTTEDIVWRLPPSLVTSGENEELKAEMMAIGESNRTTMRFRKPE